MSHLNDDSFEQIDTYLYIAKGGRQTGKTSILMGKLIDGITASNNKNPPSVIWGIRCRKQLAISTLHRRLMFNHTGTHAKLEGYTNQYLKGFFDGFSNVHPHNLHFIPHDGTDRTLSTSINAILDRDEDHNLTAIVIDDLDCLALHPLPWLKGLSNDIKVPIYVTYCTE